MSFTQYKKESSYQEQSRYSKMLLEYSGLSS